MEPLNHFQLMAAFIQGQRIIGRTVEGHGYPQVDVEVLDVTVDLVTVRSSWGGVMHVGPNASWISYYACEVRQIGPSRPSKVWLGPPPGIEKPTQLPPPPPPAKAQESIVEQVRSFGTGAIDYVGGQPKPQPNPMPSRFPQVTHMYGPSWIACRMIAGNWLAAICQRVFGAGAIDVECSIQNFSVKNHFVMFELRTQHGDVVPVRLSPETAKRLAAEINKGEPKQ
jgi:hypothetical protein